MTGSPAPLAPDASAQSRARRHRAAAVFFLLALAGAAGLAGRAQSEVVAGSCAGAFCLFAPAGAVMPVLWQSGVSSTAAAAQTADLVLTNGVVYTVDPKRPRVEAVAIRGERIIAAGTRREIQAWVGQGTRVVDLKGGFAMPGFNDSHIHLASGGRAKLEVDFQGAKSLAEFQQRIRARLIDYRAGEWVTGRGWDHTLWPERRFPTRHDVDAVSREHPMLFRRVDGHVAVANSLALEQAGITRDTPNPAGGEIERDPAAQPTGLLKETATRLVERRVPELTPAQRRRALELALEEAARFGVTSIQDNSGWDDFLLYEELKKEGKLTVRVTEWLPFTEPLARLEEMRRRGGTSDPWLKTGALKGVTDGTLGSRTAAMLAPFADDPSTTGILRLEPEALRQMVIERDKAGFQIALHAIGDRANRFSLDAFAAARAANPAPRDARHRIEHAQVVAPEDFRRFAGLGVIASMQPCHQTTDMRWAGDRLGPQRSKGAYAWKSMEKHGARMAFGTDYPVEPMNPMIGLYACLTRERPEGGPKGGWVPQEKISLEACTRAYTFGAAYAEFEENNKGQIAPGKFADIVVLSADITRIPPSQLLKTEARMTFVGGRLVYERK